MKFLKLKYENCAKNLGIVSESTCRNYLNIQAELFLKFYRKKEWETVRDERHAKNCDVENYEKKIQKLSKDIDGLERRLRKLLEEEGGGGGEQEVKEKIEMYISKQPIKLKTLSQKFSEFLEWMKGEEESQSQEGEAGGFPVETDLIKRGKSIGIIAPL
ncbi:MAG: hypothetical protein LBU29_03195 [Endomicrobium sp.]|nr:hypothetical protein [Endomicrobium sp.]